MFRFLKYIFGDKKTKNTFDHPYWIVGKGWSSYKPQWTEKRYNKKRGEYSLNRSTATITGVKKDGDLLIAIYDRWNKINHYFQIPQHAIPNGTITIEFDHQTKECSSKWAKYKTTIEDILNYEKTN